MRRRSASRLEATDLLRGCQDDDEEYLRQLCRQLMAPVKGLVTRKYLLDLIVTLLELPTAEDDGQAFCPAPAGSELEHLLAKQAAWLIGSETRKDVDTPSQATETTCSAGNVEKVSAGKQGQHKRGGQ